MHQAGTPLCQAGSTLSSIIQTCSPFYGMHHQAGSPLGICSMHQVARPSITCIKLAHHFVACIMLDLLLCMHACIKLVTLCMQHLYQAHNTLCGLHQAGSLFCNMYQTSSTQPLLIIMFCLVLACQCFGTIT